MAKKPTNKRPEKPGRRKQKTTGHGESRKTRPGRAAGSRTGSREGRGNKMERTPGQPGRKNR